MLCVPVARLVVVHAAVRVLPLPDNVTAAQPAIETPSVKLTGPVGLLPVTDAVKVTFAPTFEGFEELVSVVIVVTPPETVTLTVSALAVAERTMTLMP